MTETIIIPDPVHHARYLTTRSGLVIEVVPATEHDGPALAQFFDQVSEEDRRFRFLSACHHASGAQIDALTHTDHFRTESFLAFEPVYGDLVASAMLACDGRLDTAEVAVSIRHDHRGQGIGWALLDLLAYEAERRGVRRVISIEARANHAAIDLEREKGFRPEPFEGDPSLVVLSRYFR
jgi:GNAT superfamily N-acetyltransferase